MKKHISILMLLAFLLCGSSFFAQPVFTTPSYLCYNSLTPFSNSVTAVVTSTVAGANNYQWQILSPTNVGWNVGWYTQVSGTTGTNVAITFTACGDYSVTCTAMNNSTIISSSTSIVHVVCPNFGFTSGDLLLCNASTKTLTVNGGATSYTWTDGVSTISSSSAAIVSPITTTCYTVIAAYGSPAACTASAVACVTVGTAPTLSISTVYSNTNACAGYPVYLSASGASTYTWWPNAIGQGPGTGGATYTAYPTSNGSCYNVLGKTSSGCTASAAICPTVQAIVSLSTSLSGTVTCPGSAVALSASGGVSYTWSSVSDPAFSANTAVAVITPTLPGMNSYTVVSTNSLGCISSAYVYFSVTPNPSVSASISHTICPGQTQTLSINEPGSYTWTDGNATYSGTSIVVSPTTSTCYTITGTTAAGCNVATTSCIYTSNSNVNVSISASSSNLFNPLFVCSGSGVNLTAFGASTYTWLPGNIVAGSNMFYPVSNTCYTVVGTNSLGCTGSAVTCVTIVPAAPSITISGNNTTCLGSVVNLSASGGAYYNWMTIAGSSTMSSVSFSPSSAGQYTWQVVSTNTIGCSSAVYFGTTSVVSNPTLSISGASTICPGTSLSLSASGASSYTWNIGTTGAMVVISPTSSACYSVIASDANGCHGSAAICVSVYPISFAASPALQTVCKGSSANLNASGAVVYSWSNGASTSSINVLPLITSSYTVSGTDANGCSGSHVLTVVVDSTCSDVWPGDANSDGIVDNSDVLELGLAFSSSGPARSPGGNSFISQYASNWAGTVSTGKNLCHADCNGDGTVTMSDTIAISTNFSLTHAFRSSQASSTNADLSLITDNNLAIAGEWNRADVVLGSNDSPVSQLYGLAFDLSIDQTYLEANSAYLVYTPSFLNLNNQNVEFKKPYLSAGKIYAASVRTDHSDISGNGKIAELWFKVKADAPENATIDLSVNSSSKINSQGTSASLSGSNASFQITSATGLNKPASLDRYISLFPNPSNGLLNLHAGIQGEVNYVICDVTGRELRQGYFTADITLDISALSAGTYIIRLQANGLNTHRKLVVEK